MRSRHQMWAEENATIEDRRWRERMAQPVQLSDRIATLKRDRESAAMSLRTLGFLQDLATKNAERFGTGSLLVCAGMDSIAKTSARIAELDRQIATLEAICAAPDVHTN